MMSLLSTLFLLLTLLTTTTSTTSTSSLLSELRSLRSSSESGIIRLNDRLVQKFITDAPASRTYSLLIFFDAAMAHNNPQLQLPTLRFEFGLVSAAFAASNPSSSSLFFCDIEYSESQKSFTDFALTSLPHIRLVKPDGGTNPSDSEEMDLSTMSGMAESMAEFVQTRIGLPVGPIKRPKPMSKWWYVGFGLLLAVPAALVIRKVLKGKKVVKKQNVAMVCALAMYLFSVSGSMYGVLKKMPMAMPDQKNPKSLAFFYQGTEAQLVVEGIAIGSLYMVVGVTMALVSHGLVRVEEQGAKRLFMISAMVVSAWAVRKVVYLDNWKTGYKVKMYWPSRWRR